MLKIGSLQLDNWLLMAPMAGITSLPFRLMVKKMGAGLVTTEMVSATGLTRGQESTFRYLKSHPAEGPLAVQIFGSHPEIMATAARIVIDAGASVVDINMGCPVKKVTRTGAGAALLRDPKRVESILSRVRLSCSVPLTVKIRAGWSPSEPSYLEIAKIVQDCGADALTVHPRYATQGFSLHAEWNIIGEIKAVLNIPVIGNGDVFEPAAALRMRKETGCDGVMIGRGAVGNPWIFKQILCLERDLSIPEPTFSERKALILEHFNLLAESLGEYRAARAMRGLLLWYTKGLPHSSRFRGRITRIGDLETLIQTLDEYFETLEDQAA
ncbi:MAG: tRNA dihydrouridine synthase DusB [Deltaproteobacteria bacterium]|nr:tRNA dihydrouridine synthase DusB [Deltaproteobacteria bacterium]